MLVGVAGGGVGGEDYIRGGCRGPSWETCRVGL